MIKKMHGNTISKSYKIFSKKSIKHFPLITQFFDVPLGEFRREIAGNGHSRLVKFRIFRGSMPPCRPVMCGF
jgi:hypothetical protein